MVGAKSEECVKSAIIYSPKLILVSYISINKRLFDVKNQTSYITFGRFKTHSDPKRTNFPEMSDNKNRMEITYSAKYVGNAQLPDDVVYVRNSREIGPVLRLSLSVPSSNYEAERDKKSIKLRVIITW